MRNLLSAPDRAAWAKLSKAEGRSWKYALVAGISLGATGLAAGYLAPLELHPDSNLGPVMGILFAGPCGGFVGVILGLISSKLRVSPIAFLVIVIVAAVGVGILTVELCR